MPILAVALCAASLVPAQQTNLTAHPQDSVQSGNGNYSPFGVFSTGSGAEARTQLLVPANELPGVGAVLTGIEVFALVGGTVDYASLQITAAPTTATSLSYSFASNLVGTPTVVLPGAPLQVTHSTTAWVGIPFSNYYVHDGISSLVLDVQKIVQSAASYTFVSTAKSSYPQRLDRPHMVYVFGGPGSGQSTAANAFADDSPISFRLTWLATPTLHNVSNIGTSGNQYNIGGSLTLHVEGDPGFLFALAASTGFLSPAVMIPGIGGTFRLNGAVLFAGGLLDAAGEAAVVLNLPNDPTVIGYYLVYQAASVDPGTGAIVLTNGTDNFVNG